MAEKLREPIIAYFKEGLDSARTKKIISFIRREWKQPVAFIYPERIEDLEVPLQRQAALGGTAIFSSGDGLLHHGLPILMNSSVDLLPLPGGTANDFSREMGWHPLPRHVQQVTQKQVDCITINGRPMLTIGGWGTGEAAIRQHFMVRNHRHMKHAVKASGKWIYFLLAAWYSLKAGKYPVHYTVQTDEKEPGEEVKTANALYICNQEKLGNLFHVSRTSINDDGRFEIIMAARRSGIATLLRGLTTLFSRERQGWSTLLTSSANSIIIHVHEPSSQNYFADGEYITPSTRKFTISIIPQSINVIHHQ